MTVNSCAARSEESQPSAIAFTTGSQNRIVQIIRPDGSGRASLTAHPPSGRMPAWVGAAGRFTFVSYDGDLWLARTDGSERRRVSTNGWYSAIAPSGRLVAAFAPTGRGPLTISTLGGEPIRVLSLGLRRNEFLNSPELPQWSPDGRRIVFDVFHETDTDALFGSRVVVVDVTGKSPPRSLTPASVSDESPRWSPDGRTLSFQTGASGDLWLMSADGSSRRPVARRARTGLVDWQPWSPDGRHLAYTTTTRILVVDRAGRVVRRIVAEKPDTVAWSPDARRIAYADRGGVHVVDIATGAVRRVVRAPIRISAWAPAPRIIGDIDGSIVSIDPARGRIARLTHFLSDSTPTWSPDGTKMAFRRVGSEPSQDQPSWIYVTTPGRAARSLGAGVEFSWAPDSQRLVYETRAATRSAERLVVASVDGSKARITEGHSPAWAPQGDIIAFVREGNGASTLHVIRADGSGERMLRDGADFVLEDYAVAETYGQPVWAPDARHLLVPATQGESHAYMLLIDIDKGVVSKLTLPYGDYSWSPDGRRVARVYGYDPLVVETFDVDGSGRRVVVRIPGAMSWGRAEWSPDGEALAFIRCGTADVSDSPPCSLATVNADGADLRSIARVTSWSNVASPEEFPAGPSWARRP